MRTEKEKKREAASRVFMATHSAKEIQRERDRSSGSFPLVLLLVTKGVCLIVIS